MTPELPTSEPSPERHRRPASKWIVLIVAWTIGLIIWTFYIAAFVYVVIRVMT